MKNISENKIVWFRNAGHKHDGEESSLLDTSKYSIFDFSAQEITTSSQRIALQQKNKIDLEKYIMSIIDQNELNPQSIGSSTKLVVNGDMIVNDTITADSIAANAITAGKLATDSIKSINYSYTSGLYSNAGTFLDLSSGQIVSKNFAINASGDAFFKGEVNVGTTSRYVRIKPIVSTNTYAAINIVGSDPGIFYYSNAATESSGSWGAKIAVDTFGASFASLSIQTTYGSVTVGDFSNLGYEGVTVDSQVTTLFKVNGIDTAEIDANSLLVYSPITNSSTTTWRAYNVSGTAYYLALPTSSITVKTNVVDLDSIKAINALKQIKPVSFSYKEEVPEDQVPDKKLHHIGFIAEWMANLDSDWELAEYRYVEDGSGGYTLEPSYWKESHMIALLTSCVKDLIDRVEKLENPA